MKKVLVLGCTGSIGTSTLEIILEFPTRFMVCGLTAHNNSNTLQTLAKEFNCPTFLTSKDKDFSSFIANSHADIAVNGISGAAGLMPSVYCLENSIDLALANKETVVMAWHIVTKIAKANNCKILPVDSEHSAVFSLTEHYKKQNTAKIILTASGGPFKNSTLEELQHVTPEQALKHPTWNMGKKISIDSATLANKGLEVIEACRLFDMAPENVEVTIHPQSLVHSFIATKDGDLYAQVSHPDMKRPILSALTYPNMIENSMQKFDFLQSTTMSFSPPNRDLFPLLNLAYEAQKQGKAYTIVYNAANEVAVELFLDKKISFLCIPKLVSVVLHKDWNQEVKTIEDVLKIDTYAREITYKESTMEKF